jgi:NAD(P)-dependent dehydrogenase (short-subunit alcohol dehydrogenase family)
MDEFTGRNVLVTGGTTGIGFATAKLFIERGANVLITGLSPDRVERATTQLGSRCRGIVADNSSIGDSQNLADSCRQAFDALDVVVANAGVTYISKLDSLDEEAFDREMSINFKGTVFLIKACLPLIREGGCILTTTSVNDVKGFTGMLVYSATKAALRSMVRTLAVELAPRKIRVNAVAPGPIDTPIFAKLAEDPREVEKLKSDESGAVLMRRMGRAEEIAAAFVFLAGPQAGFITGANLRVDGGWADI